VGEDHLQRLRDWILFEAQRRGLAPADGSGTSVTEQPTFAGQLEGQIGGVTMSAGEGSQRVEAQFPISAFKSLADDFLLAMVQAHEVEESRRVLFRVYARPMPEPAGNGVRAKVRRAVLPLEEGRLDELLARADRVGPENDNDYPLFVEALALPQTVTRSWAGPDMEGGAWLVGNLFRQHDPPEIYAVIHTVIQAVGLTAEKGKLDLGTQSYLHLQDQLQLRRQRMGRRGELALGFVHSHPFLPSELDNQQDCGQCAERAACTATSAFLSKRDGQFHAAVFAAAPYAVQMVLGLTPRNEFDLRMFCLEGGQFRQRGYYRLGPAPAAAQES
jgi:hypothetical protein